MRALFAGCAVAALTACASPTTFPVEAPGDFKPAWFGLNPPVSLVSPPVAPPPGAEIPPAIVPAGEEQGYGALAAARIRTTVETVIGFSTDTRTSENQMWGRIAGLASLDEAANWLGGELDAIGLEDVAVQTYKGTGDFWWPNKWEARVLANPAYGDQTIDVVLSSAVPVNRSMIPVPIEAPLIDVGDAGAVSTEGVSGKIAIQHILPTTGAYSERAKVRESSQKLIGAGAVAVITWVEQAGNMHVYDFGQCGGPCFNIGGADGRFLSEALKKASAAPAPEIRMRLTLDAEVKTGLSAKNVIGLIPGTSDEIIIVNAHLDSWFDGAGDNADGVGVLVALARHFSQPSKKPARTLLFVGSGGHHSSGLNGPANLVAMNADLLKRAVLVVNLEHLAQFRIEAPGWQAHPTEEPKTFGVSNSSPFLISLVKQAADRYGFVIRPDITNTVPGDLGGYAPLNIARIQGIHSGPLYHTSGDVLESISGPGLERSARFYAYVIEQAAKAPTSEINPPAATATAAPSP